jgi:putative tributyrin esterase
MALLRIDHVPELIKLNTPLYIILPDPGKIRKIPLGKRKVLYLLHGLSDDASAWQRYTAIETYANDYDLVVVMPSVGRSFYTDLPNGQKYFTYLVEELPRYLRDVFGLVHKRENTLIAGNSMGGYGAFKAALSHPEMYFAAASLSGVLSLDFIHAYPDDSRLPEFAYLFGDLNKLSGGAHDPATWLKKGAENPGPLPLPHLYMYCGRQDDLYPANQQFYAASQSLGVKIDYCQAEGRHDWLFWDKYILRFLAAVLGPIPEKYGDLQ